MESAPCLASLLCLRARCMRIEHSSGHAQLRNSAGARLLPRLTWLYRYCTDVNKCHAQDSRCTAFASSLSGQVCWLLSLATTWSCMKLPTAGLSIRWPALKHHKTFHARPWEHTEGIARNLARDQALHNQELVCMGADHSNNLQAAHVQLHSKFGFFLYGVVQCHLVPCHNDRFLLLSGSKVGWLASHWHHNEEPLNPLS